MTGERGNSTYTGTGMWGPPARASGKEQQSKRRGETNNNTSHRAELEISFVLQPRAHRPPTSNWSPHMIKLTSSCWIASMRCWSSFMRRDHATVPNSDAPHESESLGFLHALLVSLDVVQPLVRVLLKPASTLAMIPSPCPLDQLRSRRKPPAASLPCERAQAPSR